MGDCNQMIWDYVKVWFIATGYPSYTLWGYIVTPNIQNGKQKSKL
ncbi:unnamed protein product [Schistosoma curassoni]|uniref:Uncharacterized protein n=1 Tax=Schistosoma curassoni TaxID=6186 RepID=A0A183JYK2_9TREM|nr:unnamed protein product [Schistosoma curassoni]